MARNRRRLDAACPFDALSDDLVLAALLRAPFEPWHGRLEAVCRRFGAIVGAGGPFRRRRRAAGLAEHGLVVAGGRGARSWLLHAGAWRPIAPMRVARRYAGSCVVRGARCSWRRFVGGGVFGRGAFLDSAERHQRSSARLKN